MSIRYGAFFILKISGINQGNNRYLKKLIDFLIKYFTKSLN